MQKTIDEEDSPQRELKVNLQDEERHGRLDQEECANQACSPSNCSTLNEAVIEEYSSDKENQEPAYYMGKKSKVGKMCMSSGASDMSRL